MTVSLRTPGDFVAAIPHLMGFHPHRSLIVVGIATDTKQVDRALRMDLDSTEDPVMLPDICQMLDGPSALVLAVIDDRLEDPELSTYRPPVLTEAWRQASAAEVTIASMVWASATSEGARWSTLAAVGEVPDPHSSTLAATMAVLGDIPRSSRDEVAALLEPIDAATLTRRANLLESGPVPLSETAAQQLVRSAVARSASGTLPATDVEILDLARAVTTAAGRDLGYALTVDDPSHTRELWLTLTRAVPQSHRTYPAVLLATATYLDGDGLLAGLALETALALDPKNGMAGLLRRAMDAGLSPTELKHAFRQSLASTEFTSHGHD